jgi:chromatin assembly factor 1 subunit A
VEGDEIEMEPTKAPDELPLPLPNPNKRKVAGSREHPNKKRKVIPLIPFQKGPIWEREIGHCEYEPFRPMQIQLFNGELSAWRRSWVLTLLPP